MYNRAVTHLPSGSERVRRHGQIDANGLSAIRPCCRTAGNINARKRLRKPSNSFILEEFKTRSIVCMSTAQFLIVLGLAWAVGGFFVAMLLGRVFRNANLEAEDS
jgi:hypothetical protein